MIIFEIHKHCMNTKKTQLHDRKYVVVFFNKVWSLSVNVKIYMVLHLIV